MATPDAPGDAAPDELPQAELRAGGGLSLFWLVPLLAALVAGWLGWQTWSTRGPEVTLVFERGEGIEAGKTGIRYKAVEVGRVNAVRLGHDLHEVEVTARLDRDFAAQVGSGSRFWVVRPRIGASGVSGLNTIVSGAYIEVDPEPGATAQRFVGLEQPPIVPSDAPGRRFVLHTARLHNVQPGTPVTFKDIDVGEVLGYELADDARTVSIHVFVRQPYARLVRDNSRFWLASGVNLSLGAEGVEVRTETLQELVLGGIKFDAPGGEGDVAAAAGRDFELFDSFDAIAEAAYTEQVRYVLYFDESVRGLSAGAPVEFRGIKLGEVVDVGLEFTRAGLNPRIPVVISLHTRRLAGGADDAADAGDLISGLVAQGLRARLQTGNLLTGQLYVELALAPDSPATFVTGRRNLPQLPTLPTEFGEFKNNVGALLAELRRLPIARIGAHAESALAGLDRLANDAAAARVFDEASSTLSAVRGAADTLCAAAAPLGARLDGTLAAIGPGSPLQVRLSETLRQLDAMARAVRELADALERQPASIIWGKENGDEP